MIRSHLEGNLNPCYNESAGLSGSADSDELVMQVWNGLQTPPSASKARPTGI